MKSKPIKFVLLTAAVALFGYSLFAPVSRSQSELPSRSLEVHFNLPKPKALFQIPGPAAAPIQQIIDLVKNVTIPAVCQAPVAPANQCSLGLVDVGDPSNDFEVDWACVGSAAPCALSANSKPMGQVRGIGKAFLNIDNLLAQSVTFQLADASGITCGTQTAHTYKAGTKPPQVYVRSYNQSGYRWFANANSVTPGSALAALNTAASVSTGTNVRLRMLIHNSGLDLLAGGETFKLQFATKGASCAVSTFSDVVSGSGGMQYLNNSSPADGDAISAIANDPTHGTDTVIPQTYEELNNFTSIATTTQNNDAEWDFALIASTANTYCLRATKSDGTVIDVYSQYPEITVTGGYGFDERLNNKFFVLR